MRIRLGLLVIGLLASFVSAKTSTRLAEFAVDCPEGWQAQQSKVDLRLNSKDGASVDFSVAVSESPLDEFAAGYIRDYQKGLRQAKLGPIRSCKVNGLPIVRAEGIAVASSKAPFHFMVGVYANGPHFLKFSAVCQSDRYAAQKVNLTAILGSVQAQ